MKHWNYEHVENYKLFNNSGHFHGYQQWLDHQKHMWYRGNFILDSEVGYHEQHIELADGRHIPAIVIYYIT